MPLEHVELNRAETLVFSSINKSDIQQRSMLDPLECPNSAIKQYDQYVDGHRSPLYLTPPFHLDGIAVIPMSKYKSYKVSWS